MSLGSIKYLVGEGARNIRANRQMSIASIGVLVACMLLIGAAVLFSLNADAVMGYIESQNDVVVFVKDKASDKEAEGLGDTLMEVDNVASVRYISKKEALEGQMEKLGNSSYLMDALMEDNPLPATYYVKVKDLELLSATVEEIQDLDLVLDVNSPTDMAATLVGIKKAVNLGGLAIVAILGAVSILIVSNTIKLTVFNRRREISIMKYVGATDSFIRLPFLVEGVIIGLCSALLAFGLLWVGYYYLLDWMSTGTSSWLQLAYQNLIQFEDIAYRMLAGFCGAGVVFGIAGSLFFVGRYLKV
ncbi:MAG: ABC transporter permease [Angelakisella sp.]|jgi:cell division transport system permease protein|nr:ABC transporter permease [Angelakisella sp.]